MLAEDFAFQKNDIEYYKHLNDPNTRSKFLIFSYISFQLV